MKEVNHLDGSKKYFTPTLSVISYGCENLLTQSTEGNDFFGQDKDDFGL